MANDETTLTNGEKQIKLQISEFYGTKFLKVNTNFNVYKNKHFANICTEEIKDIRMLSGFQMESKNNGSFTFILAKKPDTNRLNEQITELFNNYFIQF